MKRVYLSKILFFGVTSLLLLPYLVYALSSASADVSINSAVNGANSSHTWNTDNENYDKTELRLRVFDMSNFGQVVADSGIKTHTSTSGTDSLSVGWTPIVGHTYKARASTTVLKIGGDILAQAIDEDTATK